MPRKTPTKLRQPLFSIITVTFNAEREIVPTVSSVSEQDFRDFEHLLIDGASQDATLSQARLNARHQLKVFSEPDDGLYHAMNRGLEHARGKYVLFLNAGDAFHDYHTLARYADACRREDPDIVYGDTVVVSPTRKVLGPRHLSAPRILTARSFLEGMRVCHQAFMAKRKLAPQFNTDYRFSADFDWCLRCVHNSRPGRRVNLNAVTIDYLQGGTTSSNHLASLRERFAIMARNFGWMAAFRAHLGFIPRAIMRKLKGMPS